MRIDCGPTIEERIYNRHLRLREWHTWFAWRPVLITHKGVTNCYWLENVERRIGRVFGVKGKTSYRVNLTPIERYADEQADLARAQMKVAV